MSSCVSVSEAVLAVTLNESTLRPAEYFIMVSIQWHDWLDADTSHSSEAGLSNGEIESFVIMQCLCTEVVCCTG